jgi:hydroxymethylglutaryl-CoA lyase
MPDLVRITDVSPRDGLQNESGIIPTPDKVRLIELLCHTGVDEIEVTSFVSPKWVPQLGDASELVRLLSQLPGAEEGGRVIARPIFSALVPNERGMQSALNANTDARWPIIGKVSLFTAASETFSNKNTNASIDESIERFRPALRLAARHGLAVRFYVSCIAECPFEGPIPHKQVVSVSEKLLWLASHSDFWAENDSERTFPSIELDLGDTIGAATPGKLAPVIAGVRDLPVWNDLTDGLPAITLHLHDTFGRAAECVRAALDLGVRSFDGSVAGLGGCPYASKKLPDGTIQRAPGNISAELLVQTIHDAGYRTNVNLDKLREAAAFAREIVAKSRAAGPAPSSGGPPA